MLHIFEISDIKDRNDGANWQVAIGGAALVKGTLKSNSDKVTLILALFIGRAEGDRVLRLGAFVVAAAIVVMVETCSNLLKHVAGVIEGLPLSRQRSRNPWFPSCKDHQF